MAIVMRLPYADAFIGIGKHAPAGIESRYETIVPATLSQRLPLEISFQRADKLMRSGRSSAEDAAQNKVSRGERAGSWTRMATESVSSFAPMKS